MTDMNGVRSGSFCPLQIVCERIRGAWDPTVGMGGDESVAVMKFLQLPSEEVMTVSDGCKNSFGSKRFISNTSHYKQKFPDVMI